MASDELLTIAEVAATLIGFSGLAAAFQARGLSEWLARDPSSLAVIVGGGIVALVFSLLPVPLGYLGLAPGTVWTVSSLLFALALLAAAVVFVAVSRRLSREGHPEETPRLNRATLIAIVLTDVVVLLSALDVWVPRGPGAYLLGLIVCLLVSITYFAVFLVVLRTGRSA